MSCLIFLSSRLGPLHVQAAQRSCLSSALEGPLCSNAFPAPMLPGNRDQPSRNKNEPAAKTAGQIFTKYGGDA